MREWLEFAPEEVSAELNVSAGNLRVLLYRARMQLGLCLDVGWSRA
jgi:RNA polymerase sigma-70 factor (ECF subfamily)